MKRLAILVSGRGSNMSAIIHACKQGNLSATVAVVISNNVDSTALGLARIKGIDTLYLSARTHPEPAQLDSAMKQALLEHQIDLVVLAGFMKKIGAATLSAFSGRIINIHPSLLPKFGGSGMYGRHVHEAVIAAGEKETGVTIHLIDDEYDTGTILAQRKLLVAATDTPESLAARVLRLEHVFYVEVIQGIIDGSIVLPG